MFAFANLRNAVKRWRCYFKSKDFEKQIFFKNVSHFRSQI